EASNKYETVISKAQENNTVATIVQPEINSTKDAVEQMNSTSETVTKQVEKADSTSTQTAVEDAKNTIDTLNNQAETVKDSTQAAINEYAQLPTLPAEPQPDTPSQQVDNPVQKEDSKV
ncbi:hypothetical protein, partial [Enterococcus sp. HMSC05C03]